MSNKNSKIIFRPDKVKSAREKQEATSLVVLFKDPIGGLYTSSQKIEPDMEVFEGNWHALAEHLSGGKLYDYKIL